MANVKTFNDIEAFLIGLQIEKDGYELYKQASETAVFSDIKNVLSELAKMEQSHIQSFQSIINEKKENKNFLNAYENDESLTYISHIIENNIFADLTPEKILNRSKNIKDLLKIALDIEKNSILFYTEMKNISANEDARIIFNKLLSEEKYHFVLISKLLE